jgi:pimeloyl-ACP methyl ester carboxylesterase
MRRLNAHLWISGLLSLVPLASGWAAAVDHVLQRDDASSIYWTLDRQSGEGRQGILLLAQGSGRLAATENPNIANAKRLLPQFAVVTVEKYGVDPHTRPGDPFNGCSDAYYAHHTVSQRVADYQRVLAELKAQPWWNGQLVLFGGSEGGAAVALLAPTVAADAVVIFSSAPGHSFAEEFKMSVPPEVAQQASAEFEKIKADPMSSKVWGGNSYRWWADILRQDLASRLLATNSPILLVQGERDSHAPVAVARQIRDEFERSGHGKLTYWEFPGYDHGMLDAEGVSHLDEVMRKISTWLREKLAVALPRKT